MRKEILRKFILHNTWQYRGKRRVFIMKLNEIEYGLSGIYKIIFDNYKVYIGL